MGIARGRQAFMITLTWFLILEAILMAALSSLIQASRPRIDEERVMIGDKASQLVKEDLTKTIVYGKPSGDDVSDSARQVPTAPDPIHGP